MVVVLHGALGGWDEFAIAIAAFVVLWVAVKLAGRKPASDDDEDELTTDDVPSTPQSPQSPPPRPSPTKSR